LSTLSVKDTVGAVESSGSKKERTATTVKGQVGAKPKCLPKNV